MARMAALARASTDDDYALPSAPLLTDTELWYYGERRSPRHVPLVRQPSDTASDPAGLPLESRPSASTVDEPSWIRPVLGAVEQLSALQPNWNSYGAPIIDRTALRNALQLLFWSAATATPAPLLVPTSEGGVQLEWHQWDLDVELQVPPSSGPVLLFFRDHRNESEAEHEIGADIGALSKVLGLLAERTEQGHGH